MAERYFRVSSWLKNIIGKDLITNDFVAIFELVKNSFDAHATKVKIVFDLQSENPSITIADNGKGMSQDDIDNKWLFVAYSAKKTGKEDGEKRVYAGNKGVGRFSCDRLGRSLLMETKSATDKDVNVLLVDWGDFEEDPNKEFQDIELDWDCSKDFTKREDILDVVTNSGTVLKIENLREPQSWTRDKLLSLKNSLQKLVDPFAGTLDSRHLELICDRELSRDARVESEQMRVNGEVHNELFARVYQKSTVITVSLKSAVLKTSLTDRGLDIYTISEAANTACPELFASEIDFKIAYLNKAAKINFTKMMHLSSVEYGSIFLVRNGFRVFPIGESTDDFWLINRRKQQGYSRFLGTRELLGCVHVKDPYGLFEESSNREGLVSSDAVEALRNLVLSAVKRLEAYVTKISWKDKPDKEEETPTRISLDSNRVKVIELIKDLSLSRDVQINSYNKDIVSILDARSPHYDTSLASLKVIAERFNNHDLSERVDEAEQRIREFDRLRKEAEEKAEKEAEARRKAEEEKARADQEARRSRRDLEEEKKRALFLLSSGSRDKKTLECYMHEITAYNNLAHSFVTSFLIKNSAVGDYVKDFCAQILLITEKISAASKFAISAGFRLTGSFTESPMVVSTFVREYIEKIRKMYVDNIKITCGIDDSGFSVPINPMAIGLIIENLASNAHKANAENLQISFTLNGNESIDVVFSDDGKGLDPDLNKDSIFEKGVSRTFGSGLGLYYSAIAAKEANCEIFLEKERYGKLGGCDFVLRVKK